MSDGAREYKFKHCKLKLKRPKFYAFSAKQEAQKEEKGTIKPVLDWKQLPELQWRKERLDALIAQNNSLKLDPHLNQADFQGFRGRYKSYKAYKESAEKDLLESESKKDYFVKKA